MKNNTKKKKKKKKKKIRVKYGALPRAKSLAVIWFIKRGSDLKQLICDIPCVITYDMTRSIAVKSSNSCMEDISFHIVFMNL